MSVFISYSRKDTGFVNRLSQALVEKNIKVWKDDMKILAGDSLANKIKTGIHDASYFCIALSQNAMQSKWVMQEINEALVRESEQQGIIIIPLLLDDSPIPPALKDKMFVDFRDDFATGLGKILSVVANKYNIGNSGRSSDGSTYYFDYGIEHKIIDGRFFMQIDMVSFDTEEAFSILSQCIFHGNEFATREHLALDKNDTLRDYVLKSCAEEFAVNPARIPVNTKAAKTANFSIQDGEDRARFDAEVRIKWLGSATRDTVIFNFGALFGQICEDFGIQFKQCASEEVM